MKKIFILLILLSVCLNSYAIYFEQYIGKTVILTTITNKHWRGKIIDVMYMEITNRNIPYLKEEIITIVFIPEGEKQKCISSKYIYNVEVLDETK